MVLTRGEIFATELKYGDFLLDLIYNSFYNVLAIDSSMWKISLHKKIKSDYNNNYVINPIEHHDFRHKKINIFSHVKFF